MPVVAWLVFVAEVLKTFGAGVMDGIVFEGGSVGVGTLDLFSYDLVAIQISYFPGQCSLERLQLIAWARALDCKATRNSLSV